MNPSSSFRKRMSTKYLAGSPETRGWHLALFHNKSKMLTWMRVLHRCRRRRHLVTASDSVSVIIAPQQGLTRKGDKKGQTENTSFCLLLATLSFWAIIILSCCLFSNNFLSFLCLFKLVLPLLVSNVKAPTAFSADKVRHYFQIDTCLCFPLLTAHSVFIEIPNNFIFSLCVLFHFVNYIF